MIHEGVTEQSDALNDIACSMISEVKSLKYEEILRKKPGVLAGTRDTELTSRPREAVLFLF